MSDLYTVCPADPSSDRLVAALEGGGWFPLDWSPPTTRTDPGHGICLHQRKLSVADRCADRRKVPADAQRRPESLLQRAPSLPPTAGPFMSSPTKTREFAHLASLDLATQAPTPLLTPTSSGALKSLDCRRTARRSRSSPTKTASAFCGCWTPQTRPVTAPEWHPSRHPRRPALARKRAKTSHSAFSPPGRHSDVYSLNVTTREVSRWTRSETGGLNAEAFLGAGACPLAHLRRRSDLRLSDPPAPQVHRQAPRHYRHPRRPRRPGAARISRARATTT